MTINREHTWPMAIFFSLSISMCICVDILQHAAPLPFLPQHLESHGHDAAEIAAVMGGYYWSGFIGGCMITAWQVHGVLFRRFEEDQWNALRGHVVKLMVGLFLGGITLLVEARAHKVDGWTMQEVHLGCRLMQGFLGSFLFFYAYLLSVAAFKGPQQVFALTATTISLNVAEVFGPFVGATIFTTWGLAEAYYVLAAASLLNNVFLLGVWYLMPRDTQGDDVVFPPPGERTALLGPEDKHSRSPSPAPSAAASPQLPTAYGALPDTAPPARARVGDRSQRLWRVVTDRILLASLLCIAPAAMIKSSFEGILPLFADGRGFDEFQVGQMFTGVALGFILAATSLGYVWSSMSGKVRHAVSGFSLLLLGGVACTLLHSYGVDKSAPWADYVRIANGEYKWLFIGMLVVYGCVLGVTHTAPALYLGEVLDGLEDDAQCKEAANGIWNTGWEAGGSLGFIAAGLAETDSWRQQQYVLTNLGSCVVVATGAFLLLSCSVRDRRDERKGRAASLDRDEKGLPIEI